MTIDELEPGDIVDAWYHETAQFDADTLPALLERNGFQEINTRCGPVWTEEVLLVTAFRP